MWFQNPDTGEELEIAFTPELSAAVAEARSPECAHVDTIIRARIVQGGGVQIKPQCLVCGQAVGSPLKKSDNPNAEPFDEALLAKCEANEKRARWNAGIAYLKRRDQGELQFQKEYDKYLASPEWRKKRSLVLSRCKGVCEGCMEHPAQEIHHTTYKNFGSEFLFELVALCRACHLRIHGVGESDDPDSRPCRGCRFQDGNGVVCPVFDVAETVALSSEQYCGPKLLGFQPLK